MAELARDFVHRDVAEYLEADERNEIRYPAELVERMRELGFFGITIPEEFGGLALDRHAAAAFNLAMGAGWASLSALLGSHLRACYYLLKRGTPAQQRKFLPRLADGSLIFAHALHEQGNRTPSHFKAHLTCEGDYYLLNGLKDWVTNAQNADYMVVIARNAVGAGDGLAAVIVDPRRAGVHVEPDLRRPGVKGVTLCAVRFTGYEVSPEDELVGGPLTDVTTLVETYSASTSLNFAARALGASYAVLEDCMRYLRRRDPPPAGLEVIQHRFGRMALRVEAAAALYSRALGPEGSSGTLPSMAKVFCT
ncbi:MAG TPA: acyl-CoA dehydrogenase family protein, partial [Longimicrobium sp.]